MSGLRSWMCSFPSCDLLARQRRKMPTHAIISHDDERPIERLHLILASTQAARFAILDPGKVP
jgi:hypothetical protein